jgi:pyruvate carboxylase
VVDLALAAMSGSTSQPNLNSIVAALHGTTRDTGLDLPALNEFSDYWENVRAVYAPFDTAPRSGSAEVYLHEMPGGQYTNLKEQAASLGVSHRWPEIARTYAEVNQLFGDIVKVTPSSKVVGDMALFLFSRGIRPADVVNLAPGETPFPESVLDMLSGGLGWPEGGWPAPVSRAILGPQKHAAATAAYKASLKKKPSSLVSRRPSLDADTSLAKIRTELTEKLRREPTTDDLYSHLMYPQVFAEFDKNRREFGDVSVLPSAAFFYGLQPGEEITVEIEAGKLLIIRLVNISPADPEGRRSLSYELNGMAREITVTDKRVVPQIKARPKADLADPTQVAAPIPGLIAALSTTVGALVAKGDKLLMLEAMKMQTTVYAPCSGTVAELNIAVGDTVQAKDLLLRIRPA